MPEYIQNKMFTNGLYERLKKDGKIRTWHEFLALMQQKAEGNLLPDSQKRLRKLKAEFAEYKEKKPKISVTQLAMSTDVISQPRRLMELAKLGDEKISDESKGTSLTELAMACRPEDLHILARWATRKEEDENEE